jgi:hypothetical protein
MAQDTAMAAEDRYAIVQVGAGLGNVKEVDVSLDDAVPSDAN